TALSADGTVSIEAQVDWGEYELKVVTLGGAYTASSFKFNAGWYSGGAGTDTPDVLEIGLDREKYALGDVVRVRLKPRHAGQVLLSVVDNRLIEMKSVAVEAGETEATLTVTPEWGPGAYVTATLIRPAGPGRSPARALGLAWAGVDPADRRLAVDFTTPDEVSPRGPLPAALRISNLTPGETARVTIAAVDLGILNLTAFETPAPDDHYFGQRALGLDMRDLYGRLIDSNLGVRGALRSGGDAEAARMKAAPPVEELVAFFSGVVSVAADGTASAEFALPDFNGTVRLMAVAWTQSAVGHAQKDILVRDPIVVAAATPRFMAPRDESRVLLDVAHAKGPAGEVTLTFGSDGGLTGFGTAQNVTLAPGEIGQVSVPLVAVEIGDPSFTITTKTPDGTQLTKSLTIPVRLNDPDTARRSRLTIAANGGLTIDRNTFDGFEPGTARATLAAGPVALFDAPGLLTELDRYPYGCTEQTTSRALPLLYLSEVAGAIGMTAARDLDLRIETAINRVLANQSRSGAFGLWRPDRGD
ncbi:MAG: alpha-2-macroglobulin family protein, partial [Pseudomonadota bacterium]